MRSRPPGTVSHGVSTALSGERRPLAVLLAANVVSITGTALTLVAIPWFVLQTTGSATRAGGVAFCATLPVVVSALLGGPVIDRLGLRRTSVLTDLVCGAAAATVPLLHLTVGLAFWQLLVLVAVSGLFHAPGNTARGVLLPDLAERAGTPMARATSAYDGASRGARMLGAPLAGVLISVFGAANVLLVDAATFAVSAALIGFSVRGSGPVRQPAQEAGRGTEGGARRGSGGGLRAYSADLREGFTFLRHSPLLLAIVLMVMVTNGLDQAWGAVLLPVHARENLGGAVDLGLLSGVFGGCALLGTILYGAFGERLPRRWLLFWAFLVCGSPRFLVAAFFPEVPPLMVTMAVGGLAAGALNPILSVVLYERVPPVLRSRVLGATTAGVEATMPLGGLVGGYLVGAFDLRTALLACGGLYLLATLTPLAVPAWRDMDTTRGAGPPSPPDPPGPPDSPGGSAASAAGDPAAVPAQGAQGVERSVEGTHRH